MQEPVIQLHQLTKYYTIREREVGAAAYQAGRWPVNIYPLWLRSALTFLVPVAIAVTIPASGFVDQVEPTTLLAALTLAVILMAVARFFWRIGIKHYSGASA